MVVFSCGYWDYFQYCEQSRPEVGVNAPCCTASRIKLFARMETFVHAIWWLCGVVCVCVCVWGGGGGGGGGGCWPSSSLWLKFLSRRWKQPSDLLFWVVTFLPGDIPAMWHSCQVPFLVAETHSMPETMAISTRSPHQLHLCSRNHVLIPRKRQYWLWEIKSWRHLGS